MVSFSSLHLTAQFLYIFLLTVMRGLSTPHFAYLEEEWVLNGVEGFDEVDEECVGGLPS